MSRTIITHVGTTTLTRIEQTPRGRQLVERLNTMFAGGNNPPEADLTASVTALTTHLHYLWTEVWNGAMPANPSGTGRVCRQRWIQELKITPAQTRPSASTARS